MIGAVESAERLDILLRTVPFQGGIKTKLKIRTGQMTICRPRSVMPVMNLVTSPR